MAATPVAASTCFGFEILMETFTVDVQRAEERPLNVPLIAPFTIASSRLEKVTNVAIRIELSNGCVGWGEAPILPFATAEDQPMALAKAAEACEFLQRTPAMSLSSVLGEISGILPGHEFASIPIVSPAEAAELASKFCKQGFKTLKLKVGKNLNADIEVLQPESIQVLERLHEMEVTPILFEQPVHRDDWEGLAQVSHVAKDKYGVSVAADESCRNLIDVGKILKGNLADIINIKLAKVGVLGALEIIEVARASGLGLMIGGMVETRLAMGFAAHPTAGLGCFN
ncbi:hypothetical protein F0562_025248 [Nyssa sinensis]|uniref:Mandelate racemase/muconate lactonizing enzyme C-terminal domain-containing protein n=1 Tax=Nyssa sinensis TaxID=561372 RepID=A0A5J5BDQ7_9ASTE|nr:hypothetical protein F0562_025248 [Nyssa sinensis]